MNLNQTQYFDRADNLTLKNKKPFSVYSLRLINSSYTGPIL
jgi:hypothetical protein